MPTRFDPLAAVPCDHHRQSAGMALLVASLSPLLALVDYTSPLTTLGSTGASLHAGIAAQTWFLTSTPVGLAAILLTMGSVADDYGRKRVLSGGAVLLLLSSVVSAIAPTSGLFIAGRVVQGCASAALLASSLGLVAHTFPSGPERTRATGIWGAMLGLGIAIGPVYASVLDNVAGWRSVYWILSALSAVLAIVAWRGLTESRARQARKLDPLGVITIAAGASCLIAGLGEARSGWGRPDVVVLLTAGVALLAVFGLVESRVPDPMLDLALLRNPGFVVACVGALFTGVAIIGLTTYLPTVLEKALGVTPLVASGVLAFWSGLSFVSALQARRLASRVTSATQVAAALLLCGVGEILLYGLHAGGSWAHVALGLAIAGIGTGVLNAALARLSVSSVPAGRGSMGSGANNTARYLGSSLGVAITVTIVSQTHAAGGPAEAIAVGENNAVLVTTGLCLLGALITGLIRVVEIRQAPAPATDVT